MGAGQQVIRIVLILRGRGPTKALAWVVVEVFRVTLPRSRRRLAEQRMNGVALAISWISGILVTREVVEEFIILIGSWRATQPLAWVVAQVFGMALSGVTEARCRVPGVLQAGEDVIGVILIFRGR